MKRVIVVLAAVALLLAAMDPVFAERQPIKGTEGPDVRVQSQPVKGIEGPDVRATIESKGIEGPDVRARVESKGIEGPDVRQR
jgi:hypothetical protein